MTGRIPQPPKHEHAEAFMLMTYASKDGKTRIRIWNSRDGITPFTCSHPVTGVELSHADWNLDKYLPDHKPAPGDFIFTKLTPEKARPLAQQMVEKHWDRGEYPLRDASFAKDGKEAAVAHFVKEWTEAWGGDSPTLEVVS